MNNICTNYPASFLWICSFLSHKDRLQVGISNTHSYSLLKPLFESETHLKNSLDERALLQDANEIFLNSVLGNDIAFNNTKLQNVDSECLIGFQWNQYNVYQITHKYNPHFLNYQQAKIYSHEKSEIDIAYIIFNVKTVEAALRSAAALKNKPQGTSLFKILCRHASNINEPSSNGNTALHWAIKTGKEVYAILLLEAGANCNVANSRGERPLHFAALHDTDNLVGALLRKKTYINAWDNDGKTALDWAISKKKNACIKLLSSRNSS